MSESPSQKLINELGNRQYTVIVLALLLEDMELFEPLSTVLMPGLSLIEKLNVLLDFKIMVSPVSQNQLQ
jgi:hypothetical protein